MSRKMRNTLDLWIDETKMAFLGVGLVLRRPSYAVMTVVIWLLFAYFLTFFQNGFGTWNLIWSGIDFGDKLIVLGDVWRRVLENFTSLYGVLLIILSLVQGLTIALLVYVWKGREKKSAVAGLEATGVGAAFGFLALGCPSCGISLLSPVLTAIIGTGAAAMVDVMGWIFLLLAYLLLLHALRKMGYTAYIMEAAKRYDKKKHKHADYKNDNVEEETNGEA